MGPRDRAGFPLVCAAQAVRDLDERAIVEFGIPGRQLMELAGAGAARCIVQAAGGAPGRANESCRRAAAPPRALMSSTSRIIVMLSGAGRAPVQYSWKRVL